MHVTYRLNPRWIAAFGLAGLVALLGIGVGCSSDDVPGVSTSNYYGVSTDPSGTPGQISLEGQSISAATNAATLGSSSGVSLSGSFNYGGTIITVDGFYDTSSGIFAFEDATGNYSFSGTVAGIVVSGVFFGPSGNGSFIMWVGATSASVTTYCGTGTCVLGCSGSADISLAIGGTSAILSAYVDGGPVVALGTVSGSNVHFDITEGGLDGNIDGTISGSSITPGTFDESTQGWTGTWSASTGACTSTH